MAGTGYVSDISYQAVFNSESCPGLISTILQAQGHTGIDLDAPFKMLDVGCGRGLTLMVLATAFPKAKFVGIDLSANHIQEAKNRAKRLGLGNVTFVQGAFEDVETLVAPGQDIAIAQGVYSWISPSERAALLRVLSSAVKPTGIVQLSYNLEAGYAQLQPVRNAILNMIAQSDLPISAARKQAVNLILALRAKDAPFFDVNPLAQSEVAAWSASRLPYIAHEFLNENWHLSSFKEVSAAMGEHGFRYAGVPLQTRGDALPFRDLISDATLDFSTREDIIALAINAPYRNDLYVRRIEPRETSRPSNVYFGPVCPPTLPTVLQEIAGEDLTAKVAQACFEKPANWQMLQNQFPEVGEGELSDSVLDGLQRNLLLPYVSNETLPTFTDSDPIEFTSAMAQEIVNDPELSRDFRHFPCKGTGGAVMIPPLVSQTVAAFCDGNGMPAVVERIQERIAKILGGGATMSRQQAQVALEDAFTHWVPFLLSLGVIQIRNR